MANPSLQIGNDNWAIKEDNLLGYSTAGTRFVPQPITMTRATLGTRVNPSGLVEDVALLGSELVTNGDFSNGTTDWTVSSGTISVDNGRLKIDSVSGTTAEQTVTAIIGKTYKVTYDFTLGTATSGAVIITGGNYPTLDAPEGTNTFYSVATSTSFRVRPRLGATGTMFVDNISVKEATIDNLPRVDYTDGTSSLLVEPQRRNLVTQSELFSDSSWLKVGSITTTDNYTTSPSGQNNATRLQWTNATNYIYQSLSHVGSDFTLSIYLKSNTDVSQNVRLFMDNGAQGQDVVVTTQWQRFEFTNTSTPTQSNRNTGLIKSSSQVGDLDISIWGAQFEEGSYPTSYIPTSGSTVTRNQETYTKTGISDKINSEEGVLFVEMASLFNDGTFKGISLSDGSTSNVVRFYTNPTANQFSIRVTVGGVHQFNVVYTLSDLTAYNKVALKYKANDFAFWVNGVEVKTYLGGTTFASNTLNKLALSNGSGSDYFFGKVKQLQIFKTALTDSELATLTT